MERRADNRGKLGVFGDDKVDVKAIVERQQTVTDGGYRAEVARQYDVAQTKVTRRKNCHHSYGFRYHIGDSERNIVLIGNIAQLAEVGGGQFLVYAVIIVFIRDILDAKIHVSKVTALAKLLDMVNVILRPRPYRRDTPSLRRSLLSWRER